MVNRNQSGAINVLLLPFIIAVLLLVAAGSFGYWAYTGRQDYKNNVDAKIAVAVARAVKAEDVKKAAEYAEASKQPLKTYVGPEQYGALRVMYPRTWSAYVDNSQTDPAVNGYFYPGAVPGTSDQSSTYALRTQVVSQSYSDVLQNLNSNQGAKVTPYSLPKLPKIVGVRVDGPLLDDQTKSGSTIILPLRDKTLEVWTESSQFMGDFNNYILPNLTFSP